MKLFATLFFFSCLIASSLALGKVPGNHPMGLNLDRAHRAPAGPADVGVVAAGEVAVVNAFSTRGGGGVDLKSVKFTTAMVPYFGFFCFGVGVSSRTAFWRQFNHQNVLLFWASWRGRHDVCENSRRWLGSTSRRSVLGSG